jgi:hypothetical protein
MPAGVGQSVAVVQPQVPDVKPPPEMGVQVPVEHVTPQMPQFIGSFERFLQAVALAAVEQHTVPAPLHVLWRQSVSAQSVVPSQSLSTPSPHVVSVAAVGVHEQVAAVPVPMQVDVPVQAGPVPHRHAPAVQRLACAALQALHVAPAVPQAIVVVAVTQVLPLQQPAHVAESQTQTPA